MKCTQYSRLFTLFICDHQMYASNLFKYHLFFHHLACFVKLIWVLRYKAWFNHASCEWGLHFTSSTIRVMLSNSMITVITNSIARFVWILLLVGTTFVLVTSNIAVKAATTTMKVEICIFHYYNSVALWIKHS